MVTLSIDLSGLDPLRAAFAEVEAELRRELPGFLVDAATVATRRAQAEAPRGDGGAEGPGAGTLRQAIKRGPLEQGADGRLSITVAEDDSTKTDWGGGVHYGVFVQEGTRPHAIRPKRKKALAFRGAGRQRGGGGAARRGKKTVLAAVVHHPGTAPNPFFDRAIEQVTPTIRVLAHSMMRRVAARFNGRSPG